MPKRSGMGGRFCALFCMLFLYNPIKNAESIPRHRNLHQPLNKRPIVVYITNADEKYEPSRSYLQEADANPLRNSLVQNTFKANLRSVIEEEDKLKDIQKELNKIISLRCQQKEECKKACESKDNFRKENAKNVSTIITNGNNNNLSNSTCTIMCIIVYDKEQLCGVTSDSKEKSDLNANENLITEKFLTQQINRNHKKNSWSRGMKPLLRSLKNQVYGPKTSLRTRCQDNCPKSMPKCLTVCIVDNKKKKKNDCDKSDSCEKPKNNKGRTMPPKWRH